jgi:hypothetical protein
VPIDSKVVNGQFVFNDRISNAELALHDGKVISGIPDTEDGAWRTINASGYFVMPGLLQPIPVQELDELALALQGVTTTIPIFSSSSAEELLAELSEFERNARINFLPCWDVPTGSPLGSITTATKHGVRVFTVHDHAIAGYLVQNSDAYTVRVPASSSFLQDLVSNRNGNLIVVLIQTIGELQQCAELLDFEGVYSEVSLDVLLESLTFPHSDQMLALVDYVTVSSDSARHPLLPVLVHQVFSSQPAYVDAIAQLTAVTPAKAYGLEDRKATFRAGADADFFVMDPDQSDNWNKSEFPGRVIFSQTRGQILLYNEAIDVLPGHAISEL